MNVMGNDHKTGGVAFLHPFWFGFERRRYEEGVVPSHRLWGQIELERMGRSTVLCPQAPEALNLFGDLGWRVWHFTSACVTPAAVKQTVESFRLANK